jgi:membrane fusion protein (multidrug efflux system)
MAVETEEKAIQTTSRTSRLRLVAAAIVVIAVIGGFWYWFTLGRESTDDAQIDGHVAPIAARVGGTVLEVKVLDNQEVQAGDVLVLIDQSDYKLAVQRAEAELASAEANARALRVSVPITSATTSSDVTTASATVNAAQSGVTAAEKGVAAAQARLQAAQARERQRAAEQTKAQQDLSRLKDLVAKDEVSKQQYDAAVAAATAATAAHDAAVSDVAEAQAAIFVAESELTQAQAALTRNRAGLIAAKSSTQQVAMDQAKAAAADARVKQAQAALAQAKLNLGYTTVVAPIHGIVSKKSVEVGQTVQAGQPLLAIVPLDDVWVTANFKETQLDNMRPGQEAVISVDALGGREYKGHVQSIAAATGARFSLLPPENATGNYVKVVQRIPVKIVFDEGENKDHLLRPGMSVEPTVYTK